MPSGGNTGREKTYRGKILAEKVDEKMTGGERTGHNFQKK